jgi:hypothetical protein
MSRVGSRQRVFLFEQPVLDGSGPATLVVTRRDPSDAISGTAAMGRAHSVSETTAVQVT